MLRVSGLAHQLSATGIGTGYTYLAVRDSVFAKLPAGARKGLLNQERLGGCVAAAQLIKGAYPLRTLQTGESATGAVRHVLPRWSGLEAISIAKGGDVMIGPAKVLRQIRSSSGVILEVDRFIPYELPEPKGDGLHAAIPSELVKWGLGKYVK